MDVATQEWGAFEASRGDPRPMARSGKFLLSPSGMPSIGKYQERHRFPEVWLTVPAAHAMLNSSQD